MDTITIDDIRGYNPCYDPSRYLPEGWSGTALDILAIEECPAEDRLWVVLREECLDARTLRLFAVGVARQALATLQAPDPRSVAACNVAERYANGDATAAELAAARDAAAAAWDARHARLAARAAEDATVYTAAATAAATAEDAAWAAALAAALAAAEDAAWAAARTAARGAARADARGAARADARAAQVCSLREMITMSSHDHPPCPAGNPGKGD